MSSEIREPRLVIVGRPNVGKSTLFNRLLGRRRALVHDEPGVTRDRLEEPALWWVRAKPFPVRLVDTGGLGGDRFAEEIARQVEIALSQADVVIVLFDGQSGLTPTDQDVVRQLQASGLERKGIPVLGVVNKVDAETHEHFLADFFETGLDPILTISAEHARGIDDLQEAVRAALIEKGRVTEDYGSHALEADEEGSEEASENDAEDSEDGDSGEYLRDLESIDLDSIDENYEFVGDDEDEEEEQQLDRRTPKVAIVGRPNVGKSTTINALLKEDRMITSPIAGTTVDAVDSIAEIGGRDFILIDTAGMRRKSKTEQGVEVLSVVQTRKALERCDIAFLILDGEAGITDQDEKIGGMIEDVGCSVILVVNKWDTQSKTPEFTKELAAERIRKQMAFLRYAPIMFTSAKRRQGFDHLADLVDDILAQRRIKLPTKEFTEWVRTSSEIHNPMNAKFYLCHQAGKHPPTFVCHVNHPNKVHFSLRRHLINGIRERWGFMGTPLRLLFVEATQRKGPKVRPKYPADPDKKSKTT